MTDTRGSSLYSWGPDTSGAPYWESKNPWGICDRCAGKYRRTGVGCLRLEWTGLWVCQRCWDPRPPEMTPPVVWPEGVAIANAKPEPPDVFIDVPEPYSG